MEEKEQSNEQMVQEKEDYEFKPQEDLSEKKESEIMDDISNEAQMSEEYLAHSRASQYNPNSKEKEAYDRKIEEKMNELSPDTEIGADAVSSDILHELVSFELETDIFPLLNERSGCFGFNRLSAEKILTHSTSYISDSLLRLNNAENIEGSINLFKYLLYYMEDRKGPHSNSNKYVKEFLDLAIKGGDELKNEAFVLIRKQLHGHDKFYNLLRGWKFLAIVSSIFVPPSKTIYNMIMNFLFFTVHQDNIDEQIKKHANFIFVRMVKTKRCPRRILPSDKEIENIEQLRSIPINITLYSGKEETCFVESYTTMDDIKEELLKGIDMHLDRTILFSGYEVCQKKDLTEERFIADEDNICEMLALWEKEEKRYKKKEDRRDIQFKLFLKLTTFIDFDHKVDREFLSFTYHQTKYDVITGKHRLTADQIATLASLQLLDQFGSDINSAQSAINSKISKYVPDKYYDDIKNESEIRQFILDKYSQISMCNRSEAKEMYLNEFKKANIPTYATNQFDAEFNTHKSSNEDNIPNTCVIGIRPDGIVILDKDRNQQCFYSYDSLLNWGISQTDLILNIESNDNTKKLCFITSQTKVIQNLIEAYCNLICGKSIKEIKEMFNKRGKKFAEIYTGKHRGSSIYKKTKTHDTDTKDSLLDDDSNNIMSEKNYNPDSINNFNDDNEDDERKMEA